MSWLYVLCTNVLSDFKIRKEVSEKNGLKNINPFTENMSTAKLTGTAAGLTSVMYDFPFKSNMRCSDVPQSKPLDRSTLNYA